MAGVACPCATVGGNAGARARAHRVGAPAPRGVSARSSARVLPAADAFRVPTTHLVVVVDAHADPEMAYGPSGSVRYDIDDGNMPYPGAAAADAQNDTFVEGPPAWLPSAVATARGASAVTCVAVAREACSAAPAGSVRMHWDDAAGAWWRSDTGAHWLPLADASRVLREGGGSAATYDLSDARQRAFAMEVAMLRSLPRLGAAGVDGVAPSASGSSATGDLRSHLLLVHVSAARAVAEANTSAAAVRGACAALAQHMREQDLDLVGQVLVTRNAEGSSNQLSAARRRLVEAADGPAASYSPLPHFLDPQAAKVAYTNTTCTNRLTSGQFYDPAQGLVDVACPPSTSEIAAVQIALWTSLGLIVVLLLAVSALFGMDVGKDPLLYARFSVGSGAAR